MREPGPALILQLEHYALVAGSVALFAALALVMRVTRRIDSYARDAEGAATSPR